MARQPRSLDRRAVKEWFSELDFNAQEAVLGDFQSSFTSSKAERISVLESELAKLKNGSAAAARPTPTRVGRPPKAETTKRVAANKGVKVPPKYRDKDGNTWAGRGAQPRWLVAYLKKRGNKLDDLLIAKK